jgi:hypothetical protein
MIMYRSILFGSLGIVTVFAMDKPTAPTPTPTFDDLGFRIVGGESAEPGYYPFFGKCKFHCISLQIS